MTINITENRQKFIDGLRFNPNNYVRITGNLTDGGNGRCAIGAGCEYLGIQLPEQYSWITSSYEKFEAAIGIDNASDVYQLNDNGRLSYAEVADEMAEKWGME